MIVLLGIVPREMLHLGMFALERRSVSQSGNRTPMFIAALLTVVQIQKSNCVHCQMNGQRKYGVCLCIHIYIYTQWNIILPCKRRKPVICNNMDEPRRHHVKWNKSGTERQILLGITYIWNLETSNSQKQRIEQQLQGLGRWEKWRDGISL